MAFQRVELGWVGHRGRAALREGKPEAGIPAGLATPAERDGQGP